MKLTSLKKQILSLFASCILMYSSITTFAEPGTPISSTLTDIAIDIDGNYSVKKLFDDNFYTKLTFSEDNTISLTTNEEIHHLYLIWDKPPKLWSFKIEGKTTIAGENSYIHEYIKLDTPTKAITLNVPKGAVLCDVYLLGKGELPNWVQVWAQPYEKADMLVLPTHHDDEILFFGGTLPYYAGELDLKVQVAYLNNHWGEPFRSHEALNALWYTGVEAYPIIPDFLDKKFYTLEEALKYYGEEKLVDYYVELFRRFKPEVVIGHDFEGEYGHGTHMASAYAISKALTFANQKGYHDKSYQADGLWDVKKTYLHLYPENKVVMEWDKPLDYFSGKNGFEAAVEALNFHESQLKYYEMSKKGVYDCRQFGLYRTTVGNDIEQDDFFENIILESELPPETTVQTAMETISETTAKSTEALKADTISTLAQPEKVTNTQGDDSVSSVTFPVLPIILICGVVVFIIGAFLSFALNNKHK